MGKPPLVLKSSASFRVKTKLASLHSSQVSFGLIATLEIFFKSLLIDYPADRLVATLTACYKQKVVGKLLGNKAKANNSASFRKFRMPEVDNWRA